MKVTNETALDIIFSMGETGFGFDQMVNKMHTHRDQTARAEIIRKSLEEEVNDEGSEYHKADISEVEWDKVLIAFQSEVEWDDN